MAHFKITATKRATAYFTATLEIEAIDETAAIAAAQELHDGGELPFEMDSIENDTDPEITAEPVTTEGVLLSRPPEHVAAGELTDEACGITPEMRHHIDSKLSGL